ncbi:MAG: hypothetical protein ACXW1Q_09015, partial [Halobacteriota archaeon]
AATMRITVAVAHEDIVREWISQVAHTLLCLPIGLALKLEPPQSRAKLTRIMPRCHTPPLGPRRPASGEMRDGAP